MRLVNGSSPASGLLQVQFQGAAWGSACSGAGGLSYRFDLAAAAVACAQLGRPGAATLLPTSAPPGLPVLLEGVSCTNGSLTSLSDCTVVLGGGQCSGSGGAAVEIACLGDGGSSSRG